MKLFSVPSQAPSCIRTWCGLVILLAVQVCRAEPSTNGFVVTFKSADGKSEDTMVLPNLWLFVAKSKPATPFLAPGQFTAEFAGFVSAELRGSYLFKAEQLSGSVALEINGRRVLEASGTGGDSALSKPVQLNKGTNAVKVTFTSPAGDASFRLGWTEHGPYVNPVPNSLIWYLATTNLEAAEARRLGRELFLEHRCVKCHDAKSNDPVPELAMDAPAFDGVGARRKGAWLARWIADPRHERGTARMPRLLKGGAAGDAEAIAAFLAGLKQESQSTEPKTISADSSKALTEINRRSGPNAKPTLTDAGDPPEQAPDNKPLFERLHCTGCHVAPGEKDADKTKISLAHVGDKFPSATLVEFLLAPEQHFRWTRMPNFKLAGSEATNLAEYLLKASKASESKLLADDQKVARGKKLVEESGCLNCHKATGLRNRYTTPELATLHDPSKGCLADKPAKPGIPDFGFTTVERSALAAFLKTDRASLSRHSPLEFADREIRNLRCNACHGQIDLVPPMEILGGKLKPEWTAQFLAGMPFKIRADIHPKGGAWVSARMPAFKTRSQWLAEGLAAQQGYPAMTAADGASEAEASRIGWKMAGKDNGLSCISCHAVNDVPALEVFESEGTNLGLAAGRLLKPYFFRWMKNPLAVDPQSKMPAFFSEDGKSALTDYYEGDAEKQINALYEYLRLAEKMPKPAGGSE